MADVDISLTEGVPQQEIQVDRDKAADLGVSVRDVSAVLRRRLPAPRWRIPTEGNAYRILVQLADARTSVHRSSCSTSRCAHPMMNSSPCGMWSRKTELVL